MKDVDAARQCDHTVTGHKFLQANRASFARTVIQIVVVVVGVSSQRCSNAMHRISVSIGIVGVLFDDTFVLCDGGQRYRRLHRGNDESKRIEAQTVDANIVAFCTGEAVWSNVKATHLARRQKQIARRWTLEHGCLLSVESLVVHTSCGDEAATQSVPLSNLSTRFDPEHNRDQRNDRSHSRQ
jgi:hypothetical protein